jgi:hypothetical protein
MNEKKTQYSSETAREKIIEIGKIEQAFNFKPYEQVVSMAPLNVLDSEVNFILRSRSYLSTPTGEEIPVIICYPENYSDEKKYPAVICLTGSGGAKEDLVDCIPLLPFLARAGFVAATLDRPYQGERHLKNQSFDDFIEDAILNGSYIDFFSRSQFDIEILYQYLKNRGNIEKVGVLGGSHGGFESYVFASVENEIAAAVIISGIIDWEVMYNYESEAWKCLVFPDSKIYKKVKDYEKETGDILEACYSCLDTWLTDYRVWIPQLNSTPIHFSAGDSDPLCLVSSVKKAYELAKQRDEDQTVSFSVERRSHNITYETLNNALYFLNKYMK